MRRMIVALVVFITIGVLAHAQNTDACMNYWNNQYLQGKISCNKPGYITGTLQGVDCFSTTMDGLPTCCNVKCPTHESGWEIVKDSDVERHITGVVGRPYHQHCANYGIEGELTEDGFLRCSDSFTNKRTGTECKINPDMQRGFICKQKK
jgi:hypothetical protein